MHIKKVATALFFFRYAVLHFPFCLPEVPVKLP